MKVLLDRRDALTVASDGVVSGVMERPEKDETFPRALVKEDEATKGLVRGAWDRKEIRGKSGELTVIHRPDGRGRLLLVGLGPRGKFSANAVRRAAAAVGRGDRGKGARTLAIRLPSVVEESEP